MERQEFLASAREIISLEIRSSGLTLVDIVLFGSRARGESAAESDWDFLVVIKESLTFGEKAKLSSKLRRKFALLQTDADIIIKSEENLLLENENKGLLVHYALREGIHL